MSHELDLPTPRRWPEPITPEEYQAFAPEKLELVNGYLLDAEEDSPARVELLALLLRNCGLECAAMLSMKDDWRDATERAFPDWEW